MLRVFFSTCGALSLVPVNTVIFGFRRLEGLFACYVSGI